jgi:glutamyl-tRNA synthetase
MMGWTMPNGEEKFSLEDMAANFDIRRVSLGGPVFDIAKLSWLNGRYIRENLSREELARRIAEWALKPEYTLPILGLVQERIEKLSDVLPKVAHFFSPPPPLSEASFQHKKLTLDDVRKILFFAGRRLDEVRSWQADVLRAELEKLGEAMGFKIRELLFPLFVAISGQSVSTPMFETLQILGPDLSRTRLRDALEALGGLSKKQTEQLEKEYRALGGGSDAASA